jgi:hypothetical protein
MVQHRMTPIGCLVKVAVVAGAAVVGELIGPPAQGPGVGLRHLLGGQRGHDPGVGAGPADPRGVGRGGTLGDPGLVDEPGPGVVGGVLAVPFPGGEPAQDVGPGGGGDRAPPSPLAAGEGFLCVSAGLAGDVVGLLVRF